MEVLPAKKLKPKYKPTELGRVPEDWIDCKFEDVMTGFASGQTPYRSIKRYFTGNIPWITSGELNYNLVTDTIEKITHEAIYHTGLKIIPSGTFLIAITGLEAAGTRGSCAITGVEATTNQSCMALYPKTGLLLRDYLYHFYIMYGNMLALKYCQGTKQQSFTAAIAKTLPINLPPTIKEQARIVDILNDVDAVIKEIKKLIAKKSNLKKGAMQKLFAPTKTWEVKELGSIAKVIMGHSPDSTSYNYTGQGLPLIQGNADIENRKTIIRAYTSKITRKAEKGTIIMSVRAPVGEIAIAAFDCCIGRGVCSISYKNEYLYHYLIFLEESWSKISTGSTFDSVNSTEVRSLKILLPKAEDEQISIARTLSDMDLEITALEMKLEKYKILKEGMMQSLLTGKIRLI